MTSLNQTRISFWRIYITCNYMWKTLTRFALKSLAPPIFTLPSVGDSIYTVLSLDCIHRHRRENHALWIFPRSCQIDFKEKTTGTIGVPLWASSIRNWQTNQVLLILLVYSWHGTGLKTFTEYVYTTSLELELRTKNLEPRTSPFWRSTLSQRQSEACAPSPGWLWTWMAWLPYNHAIQTKQLHPNYITSTSAGCGSLVSQLSGLPCSEGSFRII